MMYSFARTFLTVTGLMIALSAGVASADIYRYQDEEGAWHFSNDNQEISSDRRYRLYIRYHKNPELYIYEHEEAIGKAAERYGIEPSLIKAVIHAESAGNVRAVSSKGAKGLMQLMPYTADEMSVNDPLNPEENIYGGTKYLSMLMDRFNKNIQLVLAAYNAGPESVDKYKGVPPYKETKNFIKRVLTYYDQFKSGVK